MVTPRLLGPKRRGKHQVARAEGIEKVAETDGQQRHGSKCPLISTPSIPPLITPPSADWVRLFQRFVAIGTATALLCSTGVSKSVLTGGSAPGWPRVPSPKWGRVKGEKQAGVKVAPHCSIQLCFYAEITGLKRCFLWFFTLIIIRQEVLSVHVVRL